MIIISVHGGFRHIKLTFVMPPVLRAVELESAYFLTVLAHILHPKNSAGPAALAKLLEPLLNFNLGRIWVHLNKARQSCQGHMCRGWETRSESPPAVQLIPTMSGFHVSNRNLWFGCSLLT